MSQKQITYKTYTPEELIASAKELNYDNIRLSPLSKDTNEAQEGLTFYKIVWLSKKGKKDEAQLSTEKKDMTPAEQREASWIPSNNTIEVAEGDEYSYASLKYTSVVASSQLKSFKQKDDKKQNRDASVSFRSMKPEEIGGGDYVPTITEDMTEEKKAAEIDRCNAALRKFADQTNLFVQAALAFDRAWNIFARKLRAVNKFRTDKDTKIFGIAQFNTKQEDAATKTTTIKEFDTPIVRMRFPIYVYNKKKHGKKGKEWNGRIGRYFCKEKGGDEVWNDVLYDAQVSKGEKVKLRVKHVDAKTTSKNKVAVDRNNMHKAITPKSLLGGVSNLFEAIRSQFGLSMKFMAKEVFVRRHKKKVDREFLKAEEIAEMGEFEEIDSGDEDEQHDASEAFMRKKKSKDDRFKKKDDSDSDEKPKQKKKAAKSESESDDSKSDAPAKKDDDSDSDAKPKPKTKKVSDSDSDSDAKPKTKKADNSDSDSDEKPKSKPAKSAKPKAKKAVKKETKESDSD